MSEREELEALVAALPDSKVPQALANLRLLVTMAPADDAPQATDDFGDAMAYIYEQSGGYTVENSRFRK